MASQFDLMALGRWYAKALVVPNLVDYAGPLMESWERRIVEGNRAGILAGTDGYGMPMTPVTYRPILTQGQRRASYAGKLTHTQRLGQHPRVNRGAVFGRGPASSGWNNNLTSAEYQRLDGPPLAPRRQFSRIITNLLSGHGRDPGDMYIWFAEGAWIEVVSVKGVHFLPFHFNGVGQIQRDARPIRPETKREMVKDLHAWAKLTIREKYYPRAG